MELRTARILVAEAIGTFALVFAGAGAVMVDAKTGALGQVGIAITFGLVIMAMIYAVGTSRARTSTGRSPSPSR
jgi:glycerol uptake facilitator-like aquaporin